MHKDSINLIKVTEIFDTKGLVAVEKVEEQGNQTLFFVIQHSDIKTRRKYLPMIREAVKKGNTSGSLLALLEDRVALEEGGKQTYGTQIGRNDKTGEQYVHSNNVINNKEVEKRPKNKKNEETINCNYRFF